MPYSAVSQPWPLPLEAGHLFFDGGGAQHAGVTELDQHRAFGVLGVLAGQAHVAQLRNAAAAGAMGSCHGDPCLVWAKLEDGGWPIGTQNRRLMFLIARRRESSLKCGLRPGGTRQAAQGGAGTFKSGIVNTMPVVAASAICRWPTCPPACNPAGAPAAPPARLWSPDLDHLQHDRLRRHHP
jgi:hypothetical protein